MKNAQYWTYSNIIMVSKLNFYCPTMCGFLCHILHFTLDIRYNMIKKFIRDKRRITIKIVQNHKFIGQYEKKRHLNTPLTFECLHKICINEQ